LGYMPIGVLRLVRYAGISILKGIYPINIISKQIYLSFG